MTEPVVTPGDTCDSCGADYLITSDNAVLFNFLNCPKANHVEVKCPNGHSENIFLCPEAFLHVLGTCHLNVRFGLNPSDEFLAECLEALNEDEDELVHSSQTQVEIDPPHWMLRELFDQLRDYENTN